MADELEKALSGKLGEENINDVLVQAMAQLLILLLQRIKVNSPVEIDLDKKDNLAKVLKDRIMSKYPRSPNLGYRLMASPS